MHDLERRELLRLTAAALTLSTAQGDTDSAGGCVAGEPTAAEIGETMLSSGGNAVDAVIAAALAAGVVALPSCGIGGYGGHMMLATGGGRRVTCIDFNSAAPASFHDHVFEGNQTNMYGWLAAGVPGTLAGLQLALDKYGTRSFVECVSPAIRLAERGFPVTERTHKAILAAGELRADPASERLFFPGGKPPEVGQTFRNPDLASMLETLAREGTVDSFYRGAVARRIAAEFAKHGGAVTERDLAAYRARAVKPLSFEWRGYEILTAPLTAGGATVLQTLATLKALGWETWQDPSRRNRALLEALRIAWNDRLTCFGDPDHARVPLDRLLSEVYARESATRVRSAVDKKAPLEIESRERPQGGTIHLSAADAAGNMAALTLTHGENFGARVTVESLGLLLGHGMSRFDPRPGQPNSPGSRKRPLNNMCPTIVRRKGQAVMAVGGVGGRRIPNAILHVLAGYAGLGVPAREAIALPRLHTEGGMRLWLDSKWAADEREAFRQSGYEVREGGVATVTAVAQDPTTKGWKAQVR